MSFIYVGLGGALGAMLRYAISQLPVKSSFPILTLITNVVGAFVIGIIVALAVRGNLNDNVILFLKTGVCGGFTTFSTFSLEAYNLFKDKRTGAGIAYALLSLILCILAVMLGQSMIKPGSEL